MLNYLNSFFSGKEIEPRWEWHKDFKDVVNSECLYEEFDVPEGKQIIINNSGDGNLSFTIGAVFDEEAEVIPGKNTEKGFKYSDARERLNCEGIYKVTIDTAQKVEFVRGKWKEVKFIQIDYKQKFHGDLSKEIERVGQLENRRTEYGRVKEMLEDGYFADGMKADFNLHLACNLGCYAITELLIKNGINVNKDHDYSISNGFGTFATKSYVYKERAIHIAAKKGDLDMIKLFVACSDADLKIKMISPETGFLGASPSQIAEKYGHLELADYIVQVNDERGNRNCSIQ